jgi:hypothetical protein
MKIMHVTTAVVWALALLLLAPLKASAGGRGGGVLLEAIMLLEATMLQPGNIFDLSAIKILVSGHLDMDTATAMSRPMHTTIQWPTRRHRR